MREPTGDECNAKARVPIEDGTGRVAFAAWYPQMGGYVGKCLIVSSGESTPVPGTAAGWVGGCFEVFVWHDGQFPFSDDPGDPDARQPRRLHHCSAEQFIEFGQLVQRIEKELGPVKFT